MAKTQIWINHKEQVHWLRRVGSNKDKKKLEKLEPLY